MSHHNRHRLFVWVPCLLALNLTGCGSWVRLEQPATHDQNSILLKVGESVGQTFVAYFDGLSGVEVFLQPEVPGDGALHLRLYASPESGEDVAQTSLPLASITSPGWYRFELTPQAGSFRQYFYAVIDLEGRGQVRVGAASGETFLNGSLYRDHQPVDAQMAFNLLYDQSLSLGGLVREVAEWLWIGLIGVILFVVPGLAVMQVVPIREQRLGWPEQLGLAAGVSLALYPVLFLWTHVVGLQLGRLYAWLPIVVGSGVLLWRQRGQWSIRWRDPLRRWMSSPQWAPDLALVFAGVATFAIRFWAIRTLDAPMWGDSVQHTLIAQLLVEHGGLFSGWQPYADLQTLTYHFGFHADVAVLHWMTGLPMLQAVLWTGQILNGLAVLALCPLAIHLGGNRWAAVVAVLVAGLLAPMPMFYVNWGRYTQLAGQVIFPAALFILWAVLIDPTWHWRLLGLGAVLLTGLALTHYRIIILAVLFVVVVVPSQVGGKLWRTGVTQAGVLGVVSGLLFLPWLINTWQGQITRTLASLLTTPASQTATSAQQLNVMGDLTLDLAPWLWVLLALSLAWGLWRRQKGVAVFGGWCFLALLATNPQWFGLPGESIISNFALLIFVYAPAGILIGAAGAWFMENWQSHLAAQWIAIGAIAALSLGGLTQRFRDPQPYGHALVTRPDVRAGQWLESNTSPEARVLVNSFLAYSGQIAVGADAGWWLPMLAHRIPTLPPISYVSEQMSPPASMARVNALTALLQSTPPDQPDVLQQLREQGVRYVYIGQRQGRVNNSEKTLEPETLLASSAYRLIYHQDRVWIFELITP